MRLRALSLRSRDPAQARSPRLSQVLRGGRTKADASAPLSEMSDAQRRGFHDALLDTDAFEDLPGLLGLFGELVLAPTQLLQRVGGGLALLAAARGHAGAQLERPQLLLGQRGALEGVVLAGRHQVPAEHGKLARCRHHRHLRSAPGADALEEGVSRPSRQTFAWDCHEEGPPLVTLRLSPRSELKGGPASMFARRIGSQPKEARRLSALRVR